MKMARIRSEPLTANPTYFQKCSAAEIKNQKSPMSRILIAIAASCLLSSIAFAQGDDATVARIIDEGKNHSQVMKTLEGLTRGIGPRVTSSPKLHKAQRWAMGKFRSWGLTNVHLEKWTDVPVGFERGDDSYGKLVAPFQQDFQISTNNWTNGTHGPVRAPAVREPKDLAEFDANKAIYTGKWILCTGRVTMRGPTNGESPELKKALDEDGIVGRVFGAPAELVWSHGTWKDKTYEKHPGGIEVEIRHSDFARVNHVIDLGQPPILEFNLDNRWIRGPIPEYNVVAEIKGTEKPDEVVIVSGHLDSWNAPGSQGANDNGTGVSVAMEAARILQAADAKPKRTIRFILWSGEEEGLLGSTAYVAAHKNEWSKISAVLVDDEGSNYHAGFQGYAKMKPVMEAAYAPVQAAFPGMKMSFNIVGDMSRDAGSDYAPFNKAGIPGFNVKQAGKQNYVYIWHTQNDRYEQAIPEYLVQGATDFAVVSYNLACAPNLVPRGK
jgi:carboxypeptidase Q